MKNFFYKILLNESVKQLFISLPKRRKIQFLLLVILFIIQSVAELLSIGSVIPFITAISRPTFLLEEIHKYDLFRNNIYFQTENQVIIISFVSFLSLIIFSALIRSITLYANYKISLMSGYEISLNIFKKIINQNLTFFYKNDSSQLTSFITNKITLSASFLMHYFGILYNLILITIIFTALIIINPIFTLLVFCFFALAYITIVLIFRKKVKKNSHNIAKNDTLIIKLLREAIQNIKIMIIHKLQFYYMDIFSELKLQRETSFISNLTISSLPKIFMETIAIVLLSSIAFIFIFTNQNDFISILPYFAVIALAGQKLLPIFQQLYFAYAALLADSESVKEITEFYTNNNNETLISDSSEKINFNKSIKFNSVHYNYGDSRFSLKNINVDFTKGDKIGIVGSSGSGKSTFIDLLMGLIDPKQGNITVDDTILTSHNISKWHNIISHIPQLTFLNNDTIYENIAYGYKKKQIDEASVRSIIKKLELDDLINVLGNGYETKVGEKGINISGGQRQKIAFARSFYRKFQVLIIDEGTSSMDNISEEKMFEKLYELENNTIFIISHRLAFLKNCDYILEFDKGEIINKGTYFELLEKSSSFKELAKNTK